MEATEEEGKDCLILLTTCSAALRASPPKGNGILVAPYHLLLGNALMSTLFSIPLGVPPPEWESAPQTPPSTAPAAIRPLPKSKWWHHLPDWVGPPSPSEATSKATPKEPCHSKQKEEMPLHKALSRSHQEAFNRNSRLMPKERGEFFWANQLHFNNENSSDLTGIF